MILIMKRDIILAVTALICWTGAFAQGNLPSRSMTIEGNYNPSMSNAEKIMPIPAKKSNDREKAVVSYATASNPFEKTQRGPMNVFAQESDNISTDSLYGLVRFGYGLRNLHDGLLDLGWLISETDEVRLSGLFGAWASDPTGDWKSRMADGDVTASYIHRFDFIDVDARVSYGHSHYNFMPGNKMTDAIMDNSDLMLSTRRADGSLGVSGTSGKIAWHGRAGGEYLSRRGLKLDGATRNNREILLRLNAGMSMPLLGGTAGAEYRQKTAAYNWTGLGGNVYDSFSSFSLSPYWNITKGSMQASVGFNVDIRTAGNHKLLASPMASISYALGKFGLHASATGGLEEYDVRSLNRISPYWVDIESISDGYTVYNANAGVSFASGTWFSMDLSAGCRHTLDEAFQVKANGLIVGSLIQQQNADVFYARLDADMQFTDRALLRMDVTYNNYIGVYKGGVMQLKPAFDANLYGRFNLFMGLDAILSYRMMLFHKVNGESMPTVNDLSVTFDYDLTSRLSAFAELRHLAGGDFYYWAGYRTLQPSALLGVSYRF